VFIRNTQVAQPREERMLETCQDISECEATLQQHLPSIRLLGQLPLNDKDLTRIFEYIQQRLRGAVNESISEVMQSTPTILACYLVWKGIQNYEEGTYWKSLEDDLGPLDSNLQAKLGVFFRDFIQSHDLLHVEIPGSHKNITPILMHGIVPRKMVAQFFDQIVYPLAHKELIYPEREEELIHWLERKRETAKKAEEFERVQKKLLRLENAEKPAAGQTLPQLRQELQRIEEQILLEDKNLRNLQAELDEIHYNPATFTKLEEDAERVKHLEEEYLTAIKELETHKEALSRVFQEIKRYDLPGLVDPKCDYEFDSFRRAAYSAIINSIEATLLDSDEQSFNKAHALLAALQGSISDGDLALPDDLIERLDDLHRTYGITHDIAGSAHDDDLEISDLTEPGSTEDDVIPTPAGTVDPQKQRDTNGEERFLSPGRETAAELPDEYIDADITAAHEQASRSLIQYGEEAPDWRPFDEYTAPPFVSLCAGLESTYLPEDGSDVAVQGTYTKEQDTGVPGIPDLPAENPVGLTPGEQISGSEPEIPEDPPDSVLAVLNIEEVAPSSSQEDTIQQIVTDDGNFSIKGSESVNGTPSADDAITPLPLTGDARIFQEPQTSTVKMDEPIQVSGGTGPSTTPDSQILRSPQKTETTPEAGGIFSSLINTIRKILSSLFRSAGRKGS